LSSYWIDNLGFITEGKLAAIFIKTFSWGFPTGRLFTTHSHINLAPEVSVAVAVYLRRSFHTIITAPSHLQPLALSMVKSGAKLHRIGRKLGVGSAELSAGTPGRRPEIGVLAYFYK
jgi:hypothetical protein